MSTIYTIGYRYDNDAGKAEAYLPLAAIVAWVKDLDGVLVDVRRMADGPRVRKGLHAADLRAELGAERYVHRPDLGGAMRGHKGPSADGLRWLADRARTDARPAVLLCSEAYPAECHRHNEIAMAPALAAEKITHIFIEDPADWAQSIHIDSRELARSMDAGDAVEYEGWRL